MCNVKGYLRGWSFIFTAIFSNVLPATKDMDAFSRVIVIMLFSLAIFYTADKGWPND